MGRYISTAQQQHKGLGIFLLVLFSFSLLVVFWLTSGVDFEETSGVDFEETAGSVSRGPYCIQECEPIPAAHQNADWADWYSSEGGDMDLYITVWAPNFVSDWTSEDESACDVIRDLFDGNMGGWQHNLDRGEWDISQYFKANVYAVATRGAQIGCVDFAGTSKPWSRRWAAVYS